METSHEAIPQTASCDIQWCCGALHCWDLCTSSTLDVAAPGIYACIRCGQDFNRWFSFCYACAAEICGPKKRHHQYPYLLHMVTISGPESAQISSCDPCATEVVSGAEDAKIYLRKTHHLRLLSRCSRPFGLQATRHNAMEIQRRPWLQNVPSGPSILPSRAVGTKNFNSCWTVVSNKQPRETCGNATGR